MGASAPVESTSGPSCDAGDCAPPTCEPGALRCNGAMLEVCGADQQSWAAQQRCATSCLCELGVEAGACAPSACVAGEVRCNGSQLQRCNECQLGYELVAECGSSEACNTATGSCDGSEQDGGESSEPIGGTEPAEPEPEEPPQSEAPLSPDAGSPQ